MTNAVRTGADCPHCRGMREQVDELTEALRQAREMAHGSTEFWPPYVWGLSGSEARVLRVLCTGRTVSPEQFCMIWEAEVPHWRGSSAQIFSVWICRLRAKLAPFGVRIVTSRAAGWRLDPRCRDAVLAACSNAGTGDGVIAPPVDRRRGNPSISAVIVDVLRTSERPLTAGEIRRAAPLEPGQRASVHGLLAMMAQRGVVARLPADGPPSCLGGRAPQRYALVEGIAR